ncbi:helix-turn-helix domain-containing protein [Kordiimonas marina]|uniref:helix-turn-helix domain-containing protein n=1 Tax=Kordiimonas marina TaxID=2872312 RepID=UPI001FF29E77|nr:helix-turn-helix domain-containing protein [Kordiimonas marina]MCJ9430450.1 DUF4115 domain-containing protein [Kordiimonas marina]
MTMDNDTVSVAELLRTAREAKGLSIQSVAKEICVRSTFLKDIDAGRFDRLPAPAFSIGFVRAYAKMLGLDCEEIVAAFKEESGLVTDSEPKMDLINAAVEPPRKGLPGWLSPVAGLVGVSLCWFLVGGNLASLGFATSATVTAPIDTVAEEKAQLAAVKAQLPDMKADTAEVPASSAPATAVAATLTVDARKPAEVQAKDQAGVQKDQAEAPAAVQVADATQASADSESQNQKRVYEEARSLFLPAAHASAPSRSATSTEGDVKLEAREDSWVRLVNADGSELWSGVLREGQSYSPQHDGQLYLSTSNAGGLMVAVGGMPAHVLGDRGQIISDLKLSASKQLSSVRPADADVTGSR